VKRRRQIGLLTVLLDAEQSSEASPASFSDRIVRWSEVGEGLLSVA
jgi:hypothetical protein